MNQGNPSNNVQKKINYSSESENVQKTFCKDLINIGDCGALTLICNA